MFTERKFVEEADSLPSGELIPWGQFTLTTKTNSGQIENLFDGSDSTYYESSSSTQCVLNFSFPVPVMLSYLCLYRSSSDSNSPKEISVTAGFQDKELSSKTYIISKKSKWAIFPMPYDLISKATLSVISCHNSYSSTKIRKIALIAGLPWFNPFSRTKHLKMLASDLFKNEENMLTLNSLYDKEVSVQVPRLAAFLTIPSWLKGIKPSDTTFDVNQPGCILTVLSIFLKGDSFLTLETMYEVPNGIKGDTKGLPYVPKKVYETLHGISVVLTIALKTGAKPLAKFCEESILESSLFKIGKIVSGAQYAKLKEESSRGVIIEPRCISWLCNCGEEFSRNVMKKITDTGRDSGQIGGLNKNQLEGVLEGLATK